MFAEQEGRNPTNEELSQILGYPLEKIQFVLDSTQDILSLDKSYAKTASDEREYTLADILPDDKSLSPEKWRAFRKRKNYYHAQIWSWWMRSNDASNAW